MKRRYVTGVTLIELVVVMAILGILASIAYPLYEQQQRRGVRTEARNALSQIALLQERHRTLFGDYASDAELDARMNNAFTDVMGQMTDNDGDGIPDRYTVAIVALPAAGPFTSYTATATAAGTQVEDDACNIFTITNTGEATAVDDSGADSTVCW